MIKKTYFLGSFVCPHCHFDGYKSVEALNLHIKWMHNFNASGDNFCLFLV